MADTWLSIRPLALSQAALIGNTSSVSVARPPNLAQPAQYVSTFEVQPARPSPGQAATARTAANAVGIKIGKMRRHPIPQIVQDSRQIGGAKQIPQYQCIGELADSPIRFESQFETQVKSNSTSAFDPIPLTGTSRTSSKFAEIALRLRPRRADARPVREPRPPMLWLFRRSIGLSRSQIRSTRLLVTVQPARRRGSSAVEFGYVCSAGRQSQAVRHTVIGQICTILHGTRKRRAHSAASVSAGTDNSPFTETDVNPGG